MTPPAIGFIPIAGIFIVDGEQLLFQVSRVMSYKKYQHVEKIGTSEVEGIEFGRCHIFPKIDGTNASIWHDQDGFHCGSRNRELSLDKDNAGFMAWAVNQTNLKVLAERFKGKRIYGEWMVPHSLKTYRETFWQKFYVFDIYDPETEKYIPFDQYVDDLVEQDVDLISPLRIIQNPTPADLEKCVQENTFGIGENLGIGEGVVIKNYDFVNKYGRTTWAKIVTNEFKDRHKKTMGAPESSGSETIETKIISKFLTDEIIHKVQAKIEVRQQGWQSRFIGELLGVVFYDFIRECSWDFIKEFRNPTIDFKRLNQLTTQRVKELKPELF